MLTISADADIGTAWVLRQEVLRFSPMEDCRRWRIERETEGSCISELTLSTHFARLTRPHEMAAP